MATMTASRAIPSSLSVPVTQNTAPIVEYRCLYTHDVRKKQKKWQDGFLRFHTFNKRVMVYDVPRNFIGDTHWRQRDPVQDGDEFELDRGALVQVGEETATVEQDISGLLEKRAKAPELPVPKEPPRPILAHNVSYQPQPHRQSQALRPKALNAVLGITKGSTGRAQLPSKSPYDIRLVAEKPSLQQERPSKRQKVQKTIKRDENVPRDTPQKAAQAEIINSHSRPNVSPSRVPASITRTNVADTLKTLAAKPTEEIANTNYFSNAPHQRKRSSDNQKEQRSTREVRLQRQEAEHVSLLSSQEADTSSHNDSPTRQHHRTQGILEHGEELSLQEKAVRSRVRSNIAKATVQQTTKVANGNQNESNPAKARARLQIAKKKPRRKLMYRDLLPTEHSTKSQTPDASTSSSRRSSQVSQISDRSPQSLAIFHATERGRLDERLQRCLDKDLDRPMNARSDGDFASVQEAAPPREREITTRTIQHPARELSRAIPKEHSTDDVLSRMDEILLSNTSRSKKTSSTHHRPANSMISICKSQDRSALDMPKGPKQQTNTANQSETQVRSSPEQMSTRPPDTDLPVSPQPPSTLARPQAPDPILSNISIPSSQPSPPPSPFSPIPKARPKSAVLPPDPSLTTAPAPRPTTITTAPCPPPLTSSTTTTTTTTMPEGDLTLAPRAPLPTFKPPTLRSPLTKSTSDLSATRPPPPASTVATAASFGPDSGSAGRQATMQAVDPWSREIWDLMGVGRDGVACGYGVFLEKMKGGAR